MTLILAIVLGTLFGYALYRVGATHADKILNMLALKDLGLAKTILAAIGLSSALFFAGVAFNVFDVGHMSIKTMYLGVFVGGALFGLGWALSAMCPGTSLANLGAGRKDAVFFVVGGLLGAGAFTLVYEWQSGFGLFEPIFGGKTSLASSPETLWIGIAIGLAMIVAAFLLPNRLR
ncbi:DUF6691 family protein [Thalassotalea maritima]|uniref:DUF6691 family protein n=1 Tax=Thalassotalea maritima TaxID=3242416 RepID=UPI003528034A